MPTSQQLAVQLQSDVKTAAQRAQALTDQINIDARTIDQQANQIKALQKQVSDQQATITQLQAQTVNAVDPALLQSILDVVTTIAQGA